MRASVTRDMRMRHASVGIYTNKTSFSRQQDNGVSLMTVNTKLLFLALT